MSSPTTIVLRAALTEAELYELRLAAAREGTTVPVLVARFIRDGLAQSATSTAR